MDHAKRLWPWHPEKKQWPCGKILKKDYDHFANQESSGRSKKHSRRSKKINEKRNKKFNVRVLKFWVGIGSSSGQPKLGQP